jgi:hypothetical protein
MTETKIADVVQTCDGKSSGCMGDKKCRKPLGLSREIFANYPTNVYSFFWEKGHCVGEELSILRRIVRWVFRRFKPNRLSQ